MFAKAEAKEGRISAVWPIVSGAHKKFPQLLMSQIELYFVSALVGSVSLILLRKKIKKIIGWIMGWTDGR